MRLENVVDTNQHYIEIDDNKFGIKRKVKVHNFSFSPVNERFSLVVVIEHYYPYEYWTYEELDDDDNIIKESELIIDTNRYGNKINDVMSIVDIYDEFIGDTEIMVYFNPSDMSDIRNGEILNPDRGEVLEDVFYISQYEYIYLAFTNPIVCLDMIKGLLTSYKNWME